MNISPTQGSILPSYLLSYCIAQCQVNHAAAPQDNCGRIRSCLTSFSTSTEPPNHRNVMVQQLVILYLMEVSSFSRHPSSLLSSPSSPSSTSSSLDLHCPKQVFFTYEVNMEIIIIIKIYFLIEFSAPRDSMLRCYVVCNVCRIQKMFILPFSNPTQNIMSPGIQILN